MKKRSEFYKRVLHRLIDMDLSLKDLSAAVGLTPSYTRSILSGVQYSENANKKICDYLNIEEPTRRETYVWPEKPRHTGKRNGPEYEDTSDFD